MTIQWFPSHMNAALKEAAKTLAAVDVVIELLDARMPEASCNPVIEDLRKQRRRPCLKVLNKADLADAAVTRAWLDRYDRLPDVKAVAISGNQAGQAAKLPGLCLQLAPHRNSVVKPLRMMILGIPNVGKSTLMNRLLNRRIQKVGAEPAVTRHLQRHTLNNRMTLTDSPGLLWPKFEKPIVGLMLAAIQAIGSKAYHNEEVAEYLGSVLLARYPAPLTARYGFPVKGLDAAGLLEAIAVKRGCFRKGTGGETDREAAARILLADYREGHLGRTSLETPESREDLPPTGT